MHNLEELVPLLFDVITIGALITFTENLFFYFNEIQSFEFFGIHMNYKFGASFLLYLCYFLIFDIFNNGNTIGKLILGINVVSNDQSILTGGIRMKRTLLKMLSIIILPISVLLFLFNDSFTIHDHYSNTMTVSTS